MLLPPKQLLVTKRLCQREQSKRATDSHTTSPTKPRPQAIVNLHGPGNNPGPQPVESKARDYH